MNGDVYVCNTCGLLKEGPLPPSGWLGVLKYTPTRPVGLGYCCSAECLEAKVKILVKAERNHRDASRSVEPTQ